MRLSFPPSKPDFSIFRSILITTLLCLSGACALPQPPQQEAIGDVGRFEFRQPKAAMQGIVIGAPQGGLEPASADLAKWLSDRTGAGFIAGYGFAQKRLSVTRPVVKSTLYPTTSDDPVHRGSVYREFKARLQKIANGAIDFYLGIRVPKQNRRPDGIEVAAAGFTFEELELLKQRYLEIRDRRLGNGSIPRLSIALDPIDDIRWRVAGVKHHGVLMMAGKGLNLRLPAAALEDETIAKAYREILAAWLNAAIDEAREPSPGMPRMDIKLTKYGRIESIPLRTGIAGVVVAAPHGTFDEHTDDMVREISQRDGLAAVIARGYTPTECGGGWRINVNRPSERRYPTGEMEIDTQRAAEIYKIYKTAVLNAAGGDLKLYFDIHQNGRQKNIEVASVGISKAEAKRIKTMYREIRDRKLNSLPQVARVGMLIEPLDGVQIGAWAAKSHGILAVAKQSLHFELPMQSVLSTEEARNSYTQILAELLDRTTDLLVSSGEEKTLLDSR